MKNMKKAKPLPSSTPPAPPHAPTPSCYTTTSYEVVKRLYAAGILAKRNYGSPSVFEYAPEDAGRIKAILG